MSTDKEELKCPICGKDSVLIYGKYPRKDRLCGTHAYEFNCKLIYQCPNCGKWLNQNEVCECKEESEVNQNSEESLCEDNNIQEFTELPSDGFDSCILCGNKTRGYAFCYSCWEEYDDDELLEKLNSFIKNGKSASNVSSDGSSIEVLSSGDIAENKNDVKLEEAKCIICGTADPDDKESICDNCDKEIENFMDSLDKNGSVRKFRDYYYNLKERIFIINDIDEAKSQCRKLIAIAELNRLLHEDTSLTKRVYNDCINLLSRKKESFNDNKYSEVIIENDREKSKINTAQDGHNVDSDMEVRIDDVLYNNCILHCYGKSISEITEKRKKCDWFIPIANNKGIYIEYWGMDTPKYLEDRREKEELYEKNNVPYIGIEKDDPKKDTQTFTDNLLRELRMMAMKHFGFMPEWKK